MKNATVAMAEMIGMRVMRGTALIALADSFMMPFARLMRFRMNRAKQSMSPEST